MARETAANRQAENEVIELVASKIGHLFNFEKMPSFYPFDFGMVDKQQGDLLGFVEVKERYVRMDHYDDYILELGKYLDAVQMKQMTGLPTFLFLRFWDGIMLLDLSGLRSDQFRIRVGGGADREPHPCMFIDKDKFLSIPAGEKK